MPGLPPSAQSPPKWSVASLTANQLMLTFFPFMFDLIANDIQCRIAKTTGDTVALKNFRRRIMIPKLSM